MLKYLQYTSIVGVQVCTWNNSYRFYFVLIGFVNDSAVKLKKKSDLDVLREYVVPLSTEPNIRTSATLGTMRSGSFNVTFCGRWIGLAVHTFHTSIRKVSDKGAKRRPESDTITKATAVLAKFATRNKLYYLEVLQSS